MIQEAMQLWKRSPFVGLGNGQYLVVSGRECYSHCNYTELLANLGVVGFVLYYSFPGLLLLKAVRGRAVAVHIRFQCSS